MISLLSWYSQALRRISCPQAGPFITASGIAPASRTDWQLFLRRVYRRSWCVFKSCPKVHWKNRIPVINSSPFCSFLSRCGKFSFHFVGYDLNTSGAIGGSNPPQHRLNTIFSISVWSWTLMAHYLLTWQEPSFSRNSARRQPSASAFINSPTSWGEDNPATTPVDLTKIKICLDIEIYSFMSFDECIANEFSDWLLVSDTPFRVEPKILSFGLASLHHGHLKRSCSKDVSARSFMLVQ